MLINQGFVDKLKTVNQSPDFRTLSFTADSIPCLPSYPKPTGTIVNIAQCLSLKHQQKSSGTKKMVFTRLGCETEENKSNRES